MQNGKAHLTDSENFASGIGSPRTEVKATSTATPTTKPANFDLAPRMQSLSEKTKDAKLIESPFAMQLDEVTRQAALHSGVSTKHAPQGNLTSIRNVSVQEGNTSPTRRRRQRQAGNGLYGGRGNVGVPLYATVPFPNPIPPMGRQGNGHAGLTMGSKACGTVYIEKAFEHGGGLACNTCQPDH